MRPAPTWTLLALPAALVGGIVVAHREGAANRGHDDHGSYHVGSLRRSSHLVALAAYALVVYCAAAFAVTRTTGGLIPYVLRWTWPVAVLASCVAALPVLRRLQDLDGPRRAHPATRSAAVAAAAVVLASTFATTRSAFDVAVEPVPSSDRSAGPLSKAIREVLPTGDYGLEWRDVRSFSAIPIGTGVELTRHGYGIDFPTDHSNRVGEFRATGRTDVPLLVIVGSTPARYFTPPPDADLIVEWDHLSATERARADEIEARIRADAGIAPTTLLAVDTTATRDELVESGAERADVEALHALEGDRESYDVWLAPAGTARTARVP